VVPPLRLRGRGAGQRDPLAGARAAGLAADGASGHRPPLPVRRLRAWVRQDITRAAEPRAKLSRRGLRWALDGLVVQHLTVARIAEGLGVAWNTANDAVLAEGKRVYYTLDREESLWRPRAPGPQWTDPAWWPASGNLA
jgi:hypothetical protein